MTEGNANRVRAIAFRDNLLTVLTEAGISSARRPRLPGEPEDRFSIRDDASVAGVQGWYLSAHRQKTMDLSRTLNATAQRAALEQCAFYAAVFHRIGYPTERAFVLTDVTVLAAVITGAASTPILEVAR